MKGKKNDIKVSELFRQKLEGYEAVPRDIVRKELMRKLVFIEFLRFSPFRFNIWYLVLITATALTGLLLLFSSQKHQSQIAEPDAPAANEIVINEHTPLISPSSSKASGSLSVIDVSSEIPKPLASTSNVTTDQFEKRSETQTSLPISPVDKGSDGLKKTEVSLSVGRSARIGVLFESSAVSGCPPLKLKFHKLTGMCDSCRWTFGDGGFSTETDPEWIFDTEGEYKVELTVFCQQAPLKTSFTIITVYPLPSARFEIAPENSSNASDQVTFLNYSSGASGFSWDFGDGFVSESFEPKHSYSKPGVYNVRLIALSDKGCRDSVKIDNVLSGSEYFIKFPNAFIPNQQGPSGGYYSVRSDESSSVFHPVYSGVTDYQLRIFSKLGILIFESNDVNMGWDGYVDGVLSSAGVYIWKVRGKFRNGEPYIKMGDVTLLKAFSN